MKKKLIEDEAYSLLQNSIDQLLAALAKRLGRHQFTFDEQEIQWIEDLSRAFAKSGRKRFNNERVEDADLLAKELGTYDCEAIRHHVGGIWEICSVKKDPAYGRAVLLAKGGASGDLPRIDPIPIIDILQRMPRGAWLDTIEHFKNPKSFF